MHYQFRRAGSLLLASLIVVAGSALAQQGGRNPTPPTPEEPTPPAPGPNDHTETIPLPNYFNPGSIGNVLKAITQATGARGLYVGATQSVVLTGTKEQLVQAKSMLEELSQQAKKKYDEQQAYQREQSQLEVRQRNQTDGQITLEFPGGTVAQYLDAVGKAGEFEGFLVQDSALLARIKMPSLKLRGVSLRTAIDALSTLPLVGPDDVRYTVYPSWVGPASQSNFQDPSDQRRVKESICVIQAQQPKRDSRNTATRAVFDLSSLQTAPKKEGVQQLLDAVSVAVELDGKSATFRAKYHEPSQLLIVQGTNEELSLVRQVLKARLPELREEAAKDAPKEEPKPPTPEQSAGPRRGGGSAVPGNR